VNFVPFTKLMSVILLISVVAGVARAQAVTAEAVMRETTCDPLEAEPMSEDISAKEKPAPNPKEGAGVQQAEPSNKTTPLSSPLPRAAGQPDPANAFRWRSAVRQSMLFLAIEHGFRFATEPGTRADLKGPFFRDWFTSAANIRGWRDGDPFLVNYIGHPMQGAVTGFIQIQNDPLGIKAKPSFKREYVRSRLRAFWWSAAYSTQFELGPLSESSLGNVGLRPTKASQHPQAFVDMTITPIVGTAWLVGEDALDHYLVRRIENKTTNRVIRLLTRSFLNPGRSFANAMRGKYPWYRDDRRL
jgi:hypothetical protein